MLRIIVKNRVTSQYFKAPVFCKIRVSQILGRNGVVLLKQEKAKKQLTIAFVQLQKELVVLERFIEQFQVLIQTEEDPLSMMNLFSLSGRSFQERRLLA